MSKTSGQLDEVLAGLLARRQSRNQLRHLTTVPAGTADFSSNGYLSLSSHPEIRRAYLARLHSHDAADNGPTLGLLGSGGSRLLDGNSVLAESLERSIADFHHGSAGLLFNSATDANLGLFGCIPQPGDVVIYDELIHASVRDGLKLSRASGTVPFAHNCVYDARGDGKEKSALATKELKSLEAVLRQLQEGSEGCSVREGQRNVFIALEGVYSMDGDLALLVNIVECVERYLPRGNGYIIVDEAHSTGILGDKGRGLVCELGLEDRIWARIHGFGKAMGCAGGILLCSPTTRSYLINYAHSLIYTTSMALTSLTSIEVTYNFLASGKAEPLVCHLRKIVCHAYNLVSSIVIRHCPSPQVLRLNADRPNSAIIPLFTSHPRGLAQHCQNSGFMVRPVVAPTVPEGKERVRLCLHAGNTFEEVEGLCREVEAWVLSWPTNEAGEEISGKKSRGTSASGGAKVEKARL